MTDRTIDEADLGFVVKMAEKCVIKQVNMGKEHGFKAFSTDKSAMPAIILCCSEYVAEEKFSEGSIVIAVLGGATRLANGSLMSEHSDTASSLLRRQIKEAQKVHPDFSIVLIVDVPCIGLNTEGPLDVVQQIHDMISGLNASDFDAKTEISCYLRINTSAGGTYYKIDQRLWTLWYTNYEVNVLGSEDDPDPGAAVATDEDLIRAIEASEACPNDDPWMDEDSARGGAIEAYRESQHDTSDDPSRHKG
jgi:hypothetical protein